LAKVLTALTAAESGRGQVVLLVGEPGVGKTRLAQEVMVRAEERGFRVAISRCYEQHASVPFLPFAEVLSDTLAGARLVLDDEAARQRVLRAVTGLLQACATETPLAILVDDLHWADSASLDLFQHLARELHGHRVLLLGTYREVDAARGHPLEAVRHTLLRERLTQEIALTRLPLAGTTALIRSYLTLEDVSTEFAAFVHDRTEGNAFFTEEVLKALVDAGALYRADGRWQPKALEHMHVPASIRTVVGARIGRLAAPAQDLLRMACVLGQEFELDVLVAASGEPEPTVLDHLDVAVAQRIVEDRGVRRGERYGFVHALVQQALYDELPGHRARRLHARAGNTLEQLRGERPEGAAELARHFLAAGDSERARRHSIRAGDHASELFAHLEALHHYEVALRLEPAVPDASSIADLHRKIGDKLNALDRTAEALVAYEVSLRSYASLDDMPGQARVERAIAWVQQERFELAAAAPHLEAALRLWPAGQEDAEYAHLLIDAARAKVFSAELAAASPLADSGLSVAERLGAPALLAEALLVTAVLKTLAASASADTLFGLYDRAEKLAHQAQDWDLLSKAYGNRAALRLQLGDLRGCVADRQRAVDVSEASGSPHLVAFWLSNLGHDLYPLGDWRPARAAMEHANDIHPYPECSSLLHWLVGDHATALAQTREAIADAQPRSDMQTLIWGLTQYAEWCLDLGKYGEAAETAAEALAAISSRGYWLATHLALPALAEALARLGSEDAAVALQEAEERTRQPEHGQVIPQLLRTRGLVLQSRRDLVGAVDALEASAACARDQHAELELARTLAALAEVARALGNQELAAEAINERAEIVDRVGPECHGLLWAAGLPRAKPVRVASDAAPLTVREREVATLVARGLTNRHIAEELVISQRTAANHVEHILSKLGFHARAQIATWVTEHGLLTSHRAE